MGKKFSPLECCFGWPFSFMCRLDNWVHERGWNIKPLCDLHDWLITRDV